MATHNLSVILTGNATNLRSVLAAAGRDVKAFSGQVEAVGVSGQTSGKLLKQGLSLGIMAVGAAMAYSVGQAIGFETELRNIQSLTQQSDASLMALGDQIVSISTRLPQSAETLAAAFYEITSSGFEGANAMMVME